MDSTDAAAIELLQTDGRIPYSDLAKRLGVSRASASERVAELIRTGRIRIVAAVHPLVLGLKVFAHASVHVDGDVATVAEHLALLESVVFLSESTGHYQLYAEIRSESLSDMGRELELLRSVAGVRKVEVMLYEEILQSLFHEEGGIDEGLHLDSFDLAILTELQRDGRMSFGALAERVGLSPSASRKRVLRLLEQNIMRIGAIRGPATDPDDSIRFGVGLTLTHRGDDVIETLDKQPGVEFLARTLGRFSLVATLSCSQVQHVELIRRLRRLPGVDTVESWLHAEVLLERYDRRPVLH